MPQKNTVKALICLVTWGLLFVYKPFSAEASLEKLSLIHI